MASGYFDFSAGTFVWVIASEHSVGLCALCTWLFPSRLGSEHEPRQPNIEIHHIDEIAHETKLC